MTLEEFLNGCLVVGFVALVVRILVRSSDPGRTEIPPAPPSPSELVEMITRATGNRSWNAFVSAGMLTFVAKRAGDGDLFGMVLQIDGRKVVNIPINHAGKVLEAKTLYLGEAGFALCIQEWNVGEILTNLGKLSAALTLSGLQEVFRGRDVVNCCLQLLQEFLGQEEFDRDFRSLIAAAG